MDRWSYPVPMAMQRHTGCHLPPREVERPADTLANSQNASAKPEASPVAAADTTRQPSEAQG